MGISIVPALLFAIASGAAPDEGKAPTAQVASDSHSASSVSVSSQASRDGKTESQSARRTVKDGVVTEEAGDAALLDSLLKAGLDVDGLEKLVRELAKRSAAPGGKVAPGGGASGGSSGGGTVTRKYVKVIKDGKVVEESGDKALGEDLGVSELRKLGLDVQGLDTLVDSLVGEVLAGALAGTGPVDGASVRKGVTVNGVPVDTHVEVKSGAEALREFETRCPELKADLHRLLQRFRGDCATPAEPTAPKAPKAPKPAKPVKKGSPSRRDVRNVR